MSFRTVVIVAGVLAAAAGAASYLVGRRYRGDIAAAADRFDDIPKRLTGSRFGFIEYAEVGAGAPLLVSHGIFQSSPAALSTHDLIPNRRTIAPSRFGYDGSAMPLGATPADQADAYAALLDALEIPEVDALGISAGATSIIQLALRHPDRVRRLVLLSANLPGCTTATVQPSWARIINRQFPIWMFKTLFPSLMSRLAGVPGDLDLSRDDADFVREFIDSLFPISPRVRGIDFDAFVGNAAVNEYPLEAIGVPTLIVHAKDDPLVRFEAAERAVARIGNARLLSLASGGHLLLGQTATVREELDRFMSSS